ncbi:MAG: EVE domain-containing protein [Candidatus Bathyarchaeia archaeon]
MTNQVWLCVISRDNFDIISDEGVYGVPNNPRALKYFKNFKRDDILLFYVVSPSKRIYGEVKVTSPIFEETKQSPWTDKPYPYRVHVSKMEPFLIRWNDFVGKISSIGKRIPMGTSIIPINNEDYAILKEIHKKLLLNKLHTSH